MVWGSQLVTLVSHSSCLVRLGLILVRWGFYCLRLLPAEGNGDSFGSAASGLGVSGATTTLGLTVESRRPPQWFHSGSKLGRARFRPISTLRGD